MIENAIGTEITERLAEHNLAPFLFVGSGFSQRYSNAPTWGELHEQIAQEIGVPIAQVRGDAGNRDGARANMERIGSILEVRYWDWTWKNQPEVATEKQWDSRPLPLKSRIAEIFSGLNLENRKDEIEKLKLARVAGIITTNYDRLLEQVFQGFKVFTGQNQMIFQPMHRWGEIYKIHGCATSPSSIIFTEEDYDSFKSRQKYLTATLLTIFLEHPIVFIGYSLTDENVKTLMGDILDCLDNEEEQEKLSRRLFFVNRLNATRKPGVQPAVIAMGQRTLQVTQINTDDFGQVYEGLTATTQKISSQLVRRIQHSLYEIIRTTDPVDRIAVVDIDELDTASEEPIEFVVGIGIEARHFNRQKSRDDVFEHLFTERPPQQIVENGIIPWLKGGANRILIPVHKFCGDRDWSEHPRLTIRLQKRWEDFIHAPYVSRIGKEQIAGDELMRFTSGDLQNHGVWFRLQTAEIALDDLASFLKKWQAQFGKEDRWQRLACIYDLKAFGPSHEARRVAGD